jgi:rubrerythrin
MPQYYCKLEEEHFNELLNVLTLISRSLEHGNEKAFEELYKIINISMRIMKKKKEKTTAPRELLSSALGKNSKIFTS